LAICEQVAIAKREGSRLRELPDPIDIGRRRRRPSRPREMVALRYPSPKGTVLGAVFGIDHPGALVEFLGRKHALRGQKPDQRGQVQPDFIMLIL